jgi:exopolysaccharide production protein ExoZ
MTISSGSKGNKQHPARDFMERRLVRIVPMYWLISALMLLKALAVWIRPEVQNVGPHPALPLGYILSSLFFLPYRNSQGIIQPVLAVGWTLTYEMFFYLLFASALALRVREVRILAPIMIALAALGIWHGSFGPAIGMLASPLLLEFLAGVLIARVVQAGWRMPVAAAVAVGLMSAVGILALPVNLIFGIEWLTRETFAVLLVLSVVMLEPKIAHKVPKWAERIGDASYSLYLVHLLLFSFIVKLVIKSGLLSPGASSLGRELETISLFVAPAILFSLALYRWVEAPINNTLRRQLKLRNARMQPTSI